MFSVEKIKNARSVDWVIWSSYFVISIIVVISLSGVIRGVLWTEEPSKVEEASISDSVAIICHLDSTLCKDLESKAVEYKITRYPDYLPDYIGENMNIGMAFLGTKNAVHLNQGIFKDMSQLVIVLYHELAHVVLSDIELSKAKTTDDNEFEKCVDHNRVKRRTSEFAEKLYELSQENDFGFIKSPLVYADGHGNRLDLSCVSEH